jgi:hypothetical protein
LDFVSDNAGSFAKGTAFPKNGGIMFFGAHRVYFGATPARMFPAEVLVAPNPPVSRAARGSRTDRTADSVEVMMAGEGDAGKGAAGGKYMPTKSSRTAKQALERDQNIVGTSTVPPAATPLQAAMDILSTPVAPNADPAATQAVCVVCCSRYFGDIMCCVGVVSYPLYAAFERFFF